MRWGSCETCLRHFYVEHDCLFSKRGVAETDCTRTGKKAKWGGRVGFGQYRRLVGVIELQINGGIMSISVLRCYRLGFRVVRHEQAGLIRLCVCVESALDAHELITSWDIDTQLGSWSVDLGTRHVEANVVGDLASSTSLLSRFFCRWVPQHKHKQKGVRKYVL